MNVAEKMNGWIQDSCELSRQNRERMKIFERDLIALKESSNLDVKAIGESLEMIRDRYSHRLPAYGTAIISVLCTMIGVLATLLIKGV